MKKQWLIRPAAMLLSAAVLFGAAPATVFAANGPLETYTDNNGNTQYPAYIVFSDYEQNTSSVQILKNNYQVYAEGKSDSAVLNGAAYDKKTNTLTVNSLVNKTLCLETNAMGDDFTLNIVGNCELAQIIIHGDDHGGSLNITGSGTLTVNASKIYDTAIQLYAEDTEAVLTFSDKTNLNLYGKVNAAAISRTKCSDLYTAVRFGNGQSNETVSSERFSYDEPDQVSAVLIDDNFKKVTGYPVASSSDPDGIYAASLTWYTDENGVKTSEDLYDITKYLYSKKLDAYIQDSDFEVLSDLTAEEVQEKGYIIDTQNRFSSSDIVIESVSLYTDKNGKKYAVSGNNTVYDFNEETAEIYGRSYYVLKPNTSVQLSDLTPAVRTIVSDLYNYSINETDFTYEARVPTKISKMTLSTENYTYSAAAKKPKVTVTDINGDVVDASDYTVTYSNNIKAGTATATVTAKGDYTGTLSKNYTIAKKDISKFTVTLSTTAYQYTGTARKPAVTVKNGTTTLKSGTDYTVSYSNNIKAGTATVKMTGKGNYSGTITKTYTISPRKISSCKISGLKASYIYTGKNLSPSFTVTYGTNKLVKNTDYTVSYKNNKAIGTATVTIKGKGNYNGTVSKTFKILPKTVSLKSVVSEKSRLFKAAWAKDSSVSGYEVLYSVNKNFTGSKQKNISRGTTTSTFVTNLPSGKTYYVKVRAYKTVNGTKIYGSYSSVKSIKIK